MPGRHLGIDDGSTDGGLFWSMHSRYGSTRYMCLKYASNFVFICNTPNISSGNYCPAGSTSSTANACPVGYKNVSIHIQCLHGCSFIRSFYLFGFMCRSFCPSKSSFSTLCSAGLFGASPGLSTASCSGGCAVGFYGAVAGLTSANCSGMCSPGYFCPIGSISPTSNICPIGYELSMILCFS